MRLVRSGRDVADVLVDGILRDDARASPLGGGILPFDEPGFGTMRDCLLCDDASLVCADIAEGTEDEPPSRASRAARLCSETASPSSSLRRAPSATLPSRDRAVDAADASVAMPLLPKPGPSESDGDADCSELPDTLL